MFAQGGYVIEAVPENEALSILSVWKETFFELQEADISISRLEKIKNGIDKKTLSILDRSLEGRRVSGKDLVYLMQSRKTRNQTITFSGSRIF